MTIPKINLQHVLKQTKKIVGHLKKSVTGRFAEAIFFFLWSDPYSNYSVLTTAKRCYLGDGDVQL